MITKRRATVLIAAIALLVGVSVCYLTDIAPAEADTAKISASGIVEGNTDPGLTAQADTADSATEEAKHNYSEIRASYIFEQFDMSPEQYTFAWFYELLDYVETDDYTSILGAMGIQPGTTSPAFFIEGDTIFGVCQDSDAVNYMYEFSKSADDTWELSNTQQLQDTGRYQDICQSFSDYQKDIDANTNNDAQGTAD